MLGVLWVLIQTIVSAAIFTQVFGRLPLISSQNVPYALGEDARDGVTRSLVAAAAKRRGRTSRQGLLVSVGDGDSGHERPQEAAVTSSCATAESCRSEAYRGSP